MDVAHAILFAKTIDISRVTADYSSAKFEVLYRKEIDFVAVHRSEKLYIQVADHISEERTFQREVSPLFQIKDGYPKMVLARTHHAAYQYEGVHIIDIADWLSGS